MEELLHLSVLVQVKVLGECLHFNYTLLSANVFIIFGVFLQFQLGFQSLSIRIDTTFGECD